MEITITLSDAQVKAIKRVNLTDDVQKFAENSFNNSLKSKFKYYSDKAETETKKLYKWAQSSGGFTETKTEGAFVTTYMQEIRDILSEL